jgi:hypothetical protein
MVSSLRENITNRDAKNLTTKDTKEHGEEQEWPITYRNATLKTNLHHGGAETRRKTLNHKGHKGTRRRTRNELHHWKSSSINSEPRRSEKKPGFHHGDITHEKGGDAQNCWASDRYGGPINPGAGHAQRRRELLDFRFNTASPSILWRWPLLCTPTRLAL